MPLTLDEQAEEDIFALLQHRRANPRDPGRPRIGPDVRTFLRSGLTRCVVLESGPMVRVVECVNRLGQTKRLRVVRVETHGELPRTERD
jgi:hypothetical protein